MAPTLRTPSTDFRHPLEILDGCHAQIRRQCRFIEQIAHHLERHVADDEAREACRAVIRFFEDTARKHHRDEEEDLFPALRRLVEPPDRGHLIRLLSRLGIEHDEIEERWAAMRERLAGVIDGSVRRIVPEMATAYTAAYERHIATEEEELLPLARRILDSSAIERLGQSMAYRRGLPGAKPLTSR